MRRTKICYISVLSDLGGAERSILPVMRAMNDSHEVYCLLPEKGAFYEQIRKSGIKTCLYGQVGRWIHKLKPIKFLYYSLSMIFALYRIKPKIVHLNTINVLKYVFPAKFLFGFKLVQHLRGRIAHTDPVFLHKILMRGFVDYGLGISAAVLRIYRSIFSGTGGYVYNPIDFSAIPEIKEAQVQIRKELNIPVDKKVLLNIGRLSPVKRHNLLLNAASELKDDYCMIICGDIIYGNTYDRQYASDIKLKFKQYDNVMYFGWREDLYKFFAVSDIYVHTALNEGFGRVLIEAIYNRVPVIAHASAGPEEILKLDNLGCLFTDSEDLSDVIKKLIGNYPSESELERRRKIVTEKYSARGISESIEGVYKELLK